jgi:hypothetical protein
MSTNKDSLLSKLTDVQRLDFQEFVYTLALKGGLDMDQLSPEKKTELENEVFISMGEYINEFIEEVADEDDKKHIRMMLSSGLNTNLIAKYPKVTQMLEMAMKQLINEFENPSKNNEETDNIDIKES